MAGNIFKLRGQTRAYTYKAWGGRKIEEVHLRETNKSISKQMIYGKITLEDWRTACVEGEEPESSFESYNLRLFFSELCIIGTPCRQLRMIPMPSLLPMRFYPIRHMAFHAWTVRSP